MNDMSVQRDQIRARYRTFAETEARGRSPLYDALALAIADSEPAI